MKRNKKRNKRYIYKISLFCRNITTSSSYFGPFPAVEILKYTYFMVTRLENRGDLQWVLENP